MSQGNTRQRSSAPPVPPPAGRKGPGIATMVVVFLAFFALALAFLLRGLVADRILVAPANLHSKTELEATNATYFNRATLKMQTGATVTLTSTARGDVKASKAAKDGVVVWDSFIALEDLANDADLDIKESRSAFDRKTARLVDCCETDTKPTPGQATLGGTFYPVGIEKKTYNVYDASTGKGWPMRYEATETRDGMEVYRFVQEIPETNTGRNATPVPSTLLGLPGPSRDVPADRWYTATVTTWIEPRSGVTVDRRQKVTTTMKGADGQGSLTVADIDLRMVADDRKKLTDKAESTAFAATLLRTAGPAVSLGAGILLFILAAFLVARGRRSGSSGA